MAGALARPPQIPWHRRMEVRVVLGLSALIAFSLGAALLATSRVVTSRSLAVASDTLDAAHAAFKICYQPLYVVVTDTQSRQ